MKKLITLLILSFVSMFSYAQTVSLDLAELSPEIKTAIEAEAQKQAMQSKITTYGEWVGLGEEIGAAVDGSLSALTSNAIDFSKTDLGKITMALVIFKVAGEDLMGYIIGVSLILFLTPVYLYFWFRDTRVKTLIEGSRLRGTAKYQTLKEKSYNNSEYEWEAFGRFALCFLATIGIASFMIFG